MSILIISIGIVLALAWFITVLILLLESRRMMKKIHSAVLDHHFYYGHPKED